MILFGTKSKNIKTISTNTTCEHCGQTAIVMQVYQNYFHLYYIPFIPYKKVVSRECTYCKNVINHAELLNLAENKAEAKKALKDLKKSVRTPLYMYSFWAIIIFLALCYCLFQNDRPSYDVQAYIEDPTDKAIVVFSGDDRFFGTADYSCLYVHQKLDGLYETYLCKYCFLSESDVNATVTKIRQAIKRHDEPTLEYVLNGPIYLEPDEFKQLNVVCVEKW